MALSAGDRLGPYKVLQPLGAGGMGEVYRATDTKLGRDVAIKVLPREVAQDPERLQRFQREAHVLASLSHPHVAAIHGLEEVDEKPFLVLELVEGEDLKQRLERGAIPVNEALEIAEQIAEALEEAHNKGIVHRDLKPANVKITPDGKAKVLDFGLAKAWAGDATAGSPSSASMSQSPTLAHSGTAAGIILGTAAYMSPEQARGKPVDKRTDVWAFGVLLYEMLTGHALFAGDTVTDIIAAVVTKEPDLDALPAETSREIRRLIARCLRKDPRTRLPDIGAARLDLQDVRAGTGEAATDETGETTRAERDRQIKERWGWAAVSVVAGIAVGALAMGLLGTPGALRAPSPAPPREVTRLVMDLPEGWVLRSSGEHLGRSARQALALSPDGRHLVYAATDGERAQLFLRPMDSERAVPIPGTEGMLEQDAPSSPFFSPDGQSIGFFAGGQLRRVPLAGGEVRTITVSGAEFRTDFEADFKADLKPAWASWAEDDTILLVAGGGLRRVRAQGGSVEPLTTVDQRPGPIGYVHLLPEMLPGGEAVLFNVARGVIPSKWDIVAQSVHTGDRRVLVEGGSDPRYVASGHIVFARWGTLMAAPFDLARLQVTGDPVVVVEDIMHNERGPKSGFRQGDGQFTVSRSGTLAYVPGGVHPMGQWLLGWVDRQGRVEALPLPPASMRGMRVSPDGTRLAYDQEGSDGNAQIWVYDIQLEVPTRLTSRGDNRAPVWSPDGTRVAFMSDGGDGSPWNIFAMAADGRGEPERLTEAGRLQFPSSWSADGVLAFLEGGEAGRDIMILPMEAEGEPEPFLQTPFGEAYPAFSPDGRWLAYSSNQTGRDEVYVRPFPAREPEYRVSTEGGQAPRWSPDGRQLFYRTGDNEETIFKVVDVTAEESFTRSQPRPLLSHGHRGSFPVASYDIAPDGQRFVMTVPLENDPEPLRMTRINVVLNWHEELRRLAPTKTP